MICSSKLEEVTKPKDPDVSGETEFAAAFGYKEALADVLCLLEDKQIELRDDE